MPIDSMLVSVAVVAMFAAFAVVLAWGQFQSSTLTEPFENGQRKRRSF